MSKTLETGRLDIVKIGIQLEEGTTLTQITEALGSFAHRAARMMGQCDVQAGKSEVFMEISATLAEGRQRNVLPRAIAEIRRAVSANLDGRSQ